MATAKAIRKTRIGAVCALTLICAFCAFAASPQDSAQGAASNPSTSPKKTTTAVAANSSASPSSTASQRATSKTHSPSGKRASRKKSGRARGQQKIDSQRAQAIQEALIREHYLTGTPTGTWNQASEEAMRRYQADNGWQSKTVPDSRALIKLGLGPSKQGLLNPESAMTTDPNLPKAPSPSEPAHSAPTSAAPPAAAVPPSPPTQSDPSAPQ